jgi:hypothetical protein
LVRKKEREWWREREKEVGGGEGEMEVEGKGGDEWGGME